MSFGPFITGPFTPADGANGVDETLATVASWSLVWNGYPSSGPSGYPLGDTVDLFSVVVTITEG